MAIEEVGAPEQKFSVTAVTVKVAGVRRQSPGQAEAGRPGVLVPPSRTGTDVSQRATDSSTENAIKLMSAMPNPTAGPAIASATAERLPSIGVMAPSMCMARASQSIEQRSSYPLVGVR
jgi:hypothetical protein